MTVVEITTFPASDSFIADPTSIKAPVANIVAKAPGFISAHAGLEFENKKTGYLVVVWESLESHKKLRAAPVYTEFNAQLKPLLAGPINVRHIEFSGDAIPALEAPATELAISVLKEGKTTEELLSYIPVVLERSKNAAGMRSEGVFGEVIEQPRTVNLLLGWESIEAHDAVNRAGGPGPEAAQRFMELVDITVVHVKFAKIA